MLELSIKEFCVLRYSGKEEFFKELIPYQKEIISNTHLYFICKKPKFRFIPEALYYDDKNLRIGFELFFNNRSICLEGVLKDYKIFFPEAIDFSIHAKYRSQLIVQYSNNSSVTILIEHVFPLFDALNNFDDFPDAAIMDYKVLYIGKSIGIKKLSNAFIRTRKGHRKLDDIVSDILEDEIFIILATIQNPYTIAISNGKFIVNKLTKNNKLSCIKDLAKTHDKKKIVDLMEACLIKYFVPEYNKLMKYTPIAGTELFIKEYKKNYDINTVLTVVDTSNIPCLYLYSDKQKSSNKHQMYNTIHTERNRVAIKNMIQNF